ncbi:hypothetical protein RRG08_002011 [Elysia crispata]|uniref:Uncharacterized protein n=1 Tax=Elysia crispata TaxID=231223 RepID=A0AAE1E5D3_9GAST|nr:hypothetical protein RRG08_002011 [Elysia crispata]
MTKGLKRRVSRVSSDTIETPGASLQLMKFGSREQKDCSGFSVGVDSPRKARQNLPSMRQDPEDIITPSLANQDGCRWLVLTQSVK